MTLTDADIVAYRRRLRCSVSRIDDIFADALVDAMSAMSNEGVDKWLKGTDIVCALGRGVDLPVIFLEEMPEVARHCGEDVVLAVADAARTLSSLTAAKAIAPFLQNMPFVARRLRDAELLRDWLRVMIHTAKVAAEAAEPLAQSAPQLFAQLSIGGVKNWVEYGIRVYATQPWRLRDYFALQTADAHAALQRERNGTLYIDNERALRMYLRAFWGLEVDFRPYSEVFDQMRRPRPHLDRLGMHIPDVYEDAFGVSGLDRYRAAIAHLAAHALWSRPFLADNFSPFQHLAIETFEDARVEWLAMQRYPGLRRLWLKMHPRPQPDACPEDHSCIRHKLAMLSYAMLNPDHGYEDEVLLKYVAEFHERMRRDPHDTQIAPQLGVKWLTQTYTHKYRQPKIWFKDTEVPWRDDNRYLWIFLEDTDNEDDFHSDHGARDHIRAPALGEDGIPPRHFPEWDYQALAYRPDWVTVFERIQPAGDANVIDELLKKHELLARRLRRIVDLLKPQLRRRIRYQEQGDELDVEMLVRAAIDMRMNITPDLRIFQSYERHGRDISMLLLLDLSESVKETPPGAQASVLQLSQEATALLAEAVQALGDPFAIAGFHSNTRFEVRYTHFKGFNEAWGELPKARLAAMEAGLSTRMGAALRRAGEELEKRREEKRLLLLLTDGAPHDIDVSDPAYLREDTRKAVIELKARGIEPFCISLDPRADEYISEIFGKTGYMVIDNINRLPEKLPRCSPASRAEARRQIIGAFKTCALPPRAPHCGHGAGRGAWDGPRRARRG